MEFIILIYLHHISRKCNFMLPVLYIPEKKKVILNNNLNFTQGRKRAVRIERRFLENPELLGESNIILETGDIDVVGLILQFLSEKNVLGGELDYSAHYVKEIKKKEVD